MCRKLARHRAALEAGADSALVAWSTQMQQVDTLGGLLNVLRHADPADKAEVYRELASASPTTTQNTPYWPKPDQHHPCA